MANSPSGDSVLARIDRVLAAFGRDRPRLTPAQVARSAGLPPATAHRLCRELTERGWLTRAPGGSYTVGTRLWELATRSAPETTLAGVSAPFLQDLQTVLGQHVQLGQAEGDEVLFLQRLSPPGARPISSSVAGRLPLHRSATGLVLLAHWDPRHRSDYAHRVLARGDGLPQGGPEQLEAVLSAVRASGHAIQTGNLEPDRTGISVPVTTGGTVVASLGAVFDRIEGPVDPATAVQALHTAARGIARTLALRQPPIE